ncbi:hypothetical protein FB565_002934 [Actinoplanes lutulentus]|uniref:Uncharacterized protein n=1 Tax=Actinoplanes lutulentus TaxID=1287878 RepID=A0A327Z1I9_9ACTN|nr:DUF6416 domain-containing protein [Actinoplanes lutulentus]MBB2943221.1 hypothetical protein [Actinoplanes lutulentus]RAK28285.1 hypothetical protein B0I29_12053 [Actinoplanes lutulentus]
MSEFMDVTVSVPKDRLPEFYVMFGQWMAGPPEAAAGQLEAATPAEAWSSSDEDLATKVWNKFSPRATAVFSTLIDAPNKKISADELASMHDVPNGRYGVAGVLAWPSRHCLAVGRKVCWRWETAGESAVYWMDDTLATLFKQARG